MLLDIGQWLQSNGEAIYGSRPFKTFGEGPTQVMEGSFTDTKRSNFTPQDIRFTTKPHTLYAFLLAPSVEGKVAIHSLAKNKNLLEGKITKIILLGTDHQLTFSHQADALHIHFPANIPFHHAQTLKITTAH
jgi:alpha-L-fucosidase